MTFVIWRSLAFIAVAGAATSLLTGAPTGSTPVSLTLGSSTNPSVFGQSITLTATVLPVNATGNVTLYDGTTVLGIRTLVNGTAAFTTALLASGSRSIQVYYSGDAHYAASLSTLLQQTVNSVRANGFAPTKSYTSGANPISLAVADFNKDGKADLAIANNGDFTVDFPYGVSVALGNGDGTFRPPVIYSAGEGPWDVAVGDFNGDGTADIVVANSHSAYVSVLLGSGDGSFRPAVNYAAGQQPWHVVVGDFNGDGICDLVIANFRSLNGYVSVLLGNGDGSFQAPLSYPIDGDQVDVLAVADFNGDGKADLAVCNGQTVSVLLGNGDGTFQDAVDYAAGVYPISLAVGDFNGDGKADIAVGAGRTGDGMSVLLGNGDGTFQTSTNYSIAGNSEAISLCVQVGDFNGDGKADIAVAVEGGLVATFPGSGDGTFQSSIAYPISYSLNSASCVVADFNGDGKTDFAVGANVLLGVNTTVSIRATGGPVVPGSDSTLYGNFPTSSPADASSLPLPNSLAGLSVLLGNGLVAPLFYVSENQVTFQVPWELAGQSQSSISVTVNGQASAEPILSFSSSAPSIFTTNSRGFGQGVILDSNNLLTDQTNPATAGSSIVQIYCSGLGPVTNAPVTGSPAQSAPLSTTLYTPDVVIGGALGTVLFSGLTPGAVGLYQVNVLVPSSSAKGPAVPLSMTIQAVASNTVTMAVQ